MFKSPQWASLIDVKTADGVVSAVSPVRLASYGLPAPPPAAPIVGPARPAPTSALGEALATAMAAVPSAEAQERPAAYTHGNPGIEAVARHARNITLCEAMYPALHMLEVVMRNSIHNAFSQHFGARDWYDQAWLKPGHRGLVAEAKGELAKRSKPHDPDRVVAELSFGFWCGMFNFAYEHGAGAAWPTLLATVLPNVPKSWRTRNKIQSRVEDARALRNRVFHHEPITFYSDLRDRHRHLVEILGWFSPEARNHVEKICRFNVVYNDNLILTD